METIILKLNPNVLTNPDLDLCYVVPEEIESLSNGLIMDNGYDYLEEINNTIGIWMKAECAKESYLDIIEILKKHLFLENDLSKSCEIYISESDCDSFENCRKVYP